MKGMVEKKKKVNINAEEMFCENCQENVLFHLRDKTHDFSLGLSTVLECLEFAIKKGALPRLPSSWIQNVEDSYDVAFDDGVFYSDIEFYKSDGYNER